MAEKEGTDVSLIEDYSDFEKEMVKIEGDGNSPNDFLNLGGDMPNFATMEEDKPGFDKKTAQKKAVETAKAKETDDSGAGTNENDDGSPKKGGETFSKFKARLDREKTKTKKFSDENTELKAQLAELKGESTQEGEGEGEGEGEVEGKGKGEGEGEGNEAALVAPVEPAEADFENEDDYVDAMIDYYAEQDEYESAVAKAESSEGEGEEGEGKETKETKPAAKAKTDPAKSVKPAEEKTELTLWDDLSDIIDDSQEASETLLEDLVEGVESGKIFMTPNMLDWLVDNDEQAAKVAAIFVEKPVASRKVARKVGSQQNLALQALADSSIEENSANSNSNSLPNISNIRGKPPSPTKDVHELSGNDFSQFEKSMNSEQKFDNPFAF